MIRIMGMAPGSPTTFWSIYANSTAEIDDILQWEYAIGNMTNRKFPVYYDHK